MKMPGRCNGPNVFSKSLKNGEGATWEDMISEEEWIDREKS